MLSVGVTPIGTTVIREAGPADLPALVAMGLRFLAESSYGLHYAANPEQMDALARQLIAGPGSVIGVSELDGTITGMLGLIVWPHFISGQRFAGEVFWWVDPSHRGHGLRLLKWAETWAQQQGAESIQMIAPDDRLGALYTRLGYVPVERTYLRTFA